MSQVPTRSLPWRISSQGPGLAAHTRDAYAATLVIQQPKTSPLWEIARQRWGP